MCELCTFVGGSNPSCPADAAADDGFQVNSTIAGNQDGPNVTRLADGRFVVIYQSADTAGNGIDVRARFFNANGTPDGTDFLVNQTTAGDQVSVALFANSNGTLSFLWQTPDPMLAGNTHLIERTFDLDGNALGAGRILSVSGSDGAYSFTQRSNGNFYLVYDNNGNVYGRTFDQDWNALTGEFQLNTTAGTQGQGRLTVLSNGNLVVTFHSNDDGDGGGGSGYTIRNRVFTSTAWTPVSINGSTNDFIINQTGTDDQMRPRINRMLDNRLLEVWQSDDTGDGSGMTIRGRFIAADGNLNSTGTSAEFIIDTTGVGNQSRPLILGFEDGRRLVYWHSFEDGTDTIRGRFVHANGTLDASDFVIADLTDAVVPTFSLVLLANQQMAFVYSGATSGDGNGAGIQAAIANPALLPVDQTFVNPGTSPFDLVLQSFTTDQAAAQISRGNAPWNDALGTAHAFTYSYRATGAGVSYSNGAAGFTQFNAAQIAAAEAAIQLWEDVANIQLTRVQDAGSQYSDSAQFRMWNYASATAGSQAANAGGFGGPNYNAGTGLASPFAYFNDDRANVIAPTVGNGGVRLLIHEIGHALGLSHPGNYNVLPNGGTVAYDGNAVYREDTGQYTVMSYFEETITHANFVDTFAATPLLHDIAAMQRIYGANMTTRTGDTIYGFNSNTGNAAFTIGSASQHVVFAVWDAGGVDTLDFSGYATQQIIRLEAEQFSSVGGLEFNVVIAKGATIEKAIGGSAADFIIGNDWGNTLTGNGGDDVLAGLDGHDSLYGNDGNDLLDGGIGQDRLEGGAGTDIATYEHATAGVVARISQLNGSGGEAFHDTYVSIEGLVGSNFNDTLGGNGGTNTLFGLGGHDYLFGYGGTDTIDGGAGNDKLDGGFAVDVMIGGLGNDIFYVDQLGDQTNEAIGGGTDKVYASKNYTLHEGAEIEFLLVEGSAGLTLTGNAFANRIIGGTGNDTLNGAGGDDRLEGGAGNDHLDGAAGVDRAYGGLGDDIYAVDDVADVVVESAVDGGIDIVYASVTRTLGANFENLTLSGNDALTGKGNTLDNVILGNSGANTLRGEGGADTLNGRLGVDMLYGGAGNDIFVFAKLADTGPTLATRDQIRDFATGDRIDFSGIAADAGVTLSFIEDAAFSGVAGQVRQLASGTNTIVAGDINGDRVTDFSIVLIGTYDLGAGDFIL